MNEAARIVEEYLRVPRDPAECKIVKMEMWNDSAERLLVHAGLAKP